MWARRLQASGHEVGVVDGVGVDASEPQRAVVADGDEGIGSRLLDGDLRIELSRGVDAKAAQIDVILAAGSLAVEAVDAIVAKACAEYNRVIACRNIDAVVAAPWRLWIQSRGRTFQQTNSHVPRPARCSRLV